MKINSVLLSLPFSNVTLLTITFVVLKALGHLGWEWVWVLSPIWIAASVVVCCLLGVGIGMLVGMLLCWRLWNED